MRVRVIGVTYRASGAVLAWISSLQFAWQARGPAGEDRLVVVAVDNDSPDETADVLRARAPFVTLLSQPANVGFAAGCNVGLLTAEPEEIVVVMNPDVRVASNFFDVLAGLDWPSDLAVRGPRVLARDGAVEQSARAFPTIATGLFGRTSFVARIFPNSAPVRRQLLADVDSGPVDVDWISGACMIAPSERWGAVGPFDETYFMYWEDADWCRRAHDRGLRISYEPSLRVHHSQGASSSYRPLATIVFFHRSAWRYHRTHAQSGLVRDIVVVAGLIGRTGLKVALSLVRFRRDDVERSRMQNR